MAPPSIARIAATVALARVSMDEAFATAALDAELRRLGADRRDAALATEIVYGTLRALPAIDEAVASRLTKPARTLDGFVHAALRAATYQLLFLTSAPPHAIVADTVEIVRKKRGAKLGGLANAVLRKIAAARPEAPAPPDRLMLPSWLVSRLASAIGEERARAFTSLRPLPPPIGLRVVARDDVDAVARDVVAARPEAEIVRGEIAPRALLVRRAGDPRALPGHDEGRFAIQEQGAQVVGLSLGAREGEHVLDACAGRGGKTAQLAEMVGAKGSVTALDLYESKLDRIGVELARLGLSATTVETMAVDLTVGTGGLDARYDRVLVDAPCTGLGTVHRRPEILLRVGPDDPARMAETQAAILSNAARLVRPGGLLVFAVCSPMDEEASGVLARTKDALAGFAIDRDPWPLDTIRRDPDGIARIGPWIGEADAYQVVRLRRGP